MADLFGEERENRRGKKSQEGKQNKSPPPPPQPLFPSAQGVDPPLGISLRKSVRIIMTEKTAVTYIACMKTSTLPFPCETKANSRQLHVGWLTNKRNEQAATCISVYVYVCITMPMVMSVMPKHKDHKCQYLCLCLCISVYVYVSCLHYMSLCLCHVCVYIFAQA